MPTGKHKRILIYKTKAVKSLSKQGYPQPRCHSKARSLNRQLKNGQWDNLKWCIADGLALFLSWKYNSSLLKSSKKVRWWRHYTKWHQFIIHQCVIRVSMSSYPLQVACCKGSHFLFLYHAEIMSAIMETLYRRVFNLWTGLRRFVVRLYRLLSFGPQPAHLLS